MARINATPQMKRARSDGYTSPKGARGTSPDEEVGLHRAVNSTGSEEGSYPAASPASTLTSTPGSGGRKLRRKFTLRLFLTRRFGLKQRDSDGDGAGEYLLGEEGEEGEEYHGRFSVMWLLVVGGETSHIACMCCSSWHLWPLLLPHPSHVGLRCCCLLHFCGHLCRLPRRDYKHQVPWHFPQAACLERELVCGVGGGVWAICISRALSYFLVNSEQVVARHFGLCLQLL